MGAQKSCSPGNNNFQRIEPPDILMFLLDTSLNIILYDQTICIHEGNYWGWRLMCKLGQDDCPEADPCGRPLGNHLDLAHLSPFPPPIHHLITPTEETGRSQTM